MQCCLFNIVPLPCNGVYTILIAPYSALVYLHCPLQCTDVPRMLRFAMHLCHYCIAPYSDLVFLRHSNLPCTGCSTVLQLLLLFSTTRSFLWTALTLAHPLVCQLILLGAVLTDVRITWHSTFHVFVVSRRFR